MNRNFWDWWNIAAMTFCGGIGIIFMLENEPIYAVMAFMFYWGFNLEIKIKAVKNE